MKPIVIDKTALDDQIKLHGVEDAFLEFMNGVANHVQMEVMGKVKNPKLVSFKTESKPIDPRQLNLFPQEVCYD